MPEKLLDSINDPSDLRKLPVKELPKLAGEIRELMIDVVSRTGGHLASSLGAVELTLALHYCYNTPVDKLVWDVGHQAYAHKIITGRRARFASLRQFNGISGFPRTEESIYDASSSGHASASISTALGMAVARDLRGEKYTVVAIIGDGSLSGGLAFEGLNNLGSSSSGMTIVLNDNEMSISRNVGALSRYLTRVLTDKRYTRIKTEIWDRLGGSSVGKSIRSIVKSIDDAVKHIVIPGKLFEDMGIRYLGPVDGHDIPAMIEIFRSVKEQPLLPQLVHVITKKGKGYCFAEKDATKYHGIGSFSRETGDIITKPIVSSTPTYSAVFGTTLLELAATRPQVIAITAAMRDGTKLTQFSREYPDRFFDVGIAESHSVTFAAGLAHQGLCPVVAIYSTFLQRAYDQLMHDVALDNLHVVFCVDRAGLVGDDGPTHHGMFDLSYLRSVPGATVMAPSNGNELRHMLFTAIDCCKGPVFIRYPRGGTPESLRDEPFTALSSGLPQVIVKGKEIALLAIGDFFSIADKTAALLGEQGHHPTVLNARFAKPLDSSFYTTLFESHRLVVTFENNSVAGGFGTGIMELVNSIGCTQRVEVLPIGLPDQFIPHGERSIVLHTLGLDPESIVRRIVARLTAFDAPARRRPLLPRKRVLQ
ncbi:MAG: 1-deoxy-D-xylulose-5-phosphate synthase [Chitinispirillaceae bacterium]|nr:1-deoxy-D-xylulose-5-phosphate synthase [Chitinispirillaceae bacterium]